MLPYDKKHEHKRRSYYLRAVFKSKYKAQRWAKTLKRWGFRYRIRTLDEVQHYQYRSISDDLVEHYFDYGVWVCRGKMDLKEVDD
jgi:transposase